MDVVDVFGFSKTTVYRMSESGQMPSAMLGGSRIYDPSTLAMWVASKEPLIARAARKLEKEKEDAKGKWALGEKVGKCAFYAAF